MAQLTPAQVQQLLVDYRKGRPLQDIAADLGITRDGVTYHARRNGLAKRGHGGYRTPRGPGLIEKTQQRQGRAPIDPRDWITRAACLDVNVEVFFPATTRLEDAASAIEVCADCPVRAQCLAHALAVGEEHGVWGGTTPMQRTFLRRKAMTA